MNKIIIDTDPGVDDALAISLAIYSKLDVNAITTVFGNSNIQNTTQNALTIMDLVQKNIPVYKGSSKPLQGKSIRASSHGENGLGGYKRIISKNEESESAIHYLIRLLENSKPKSISIVCMGPSTNIAKIAMQNPKLVQKIKEIIILGGVFGEEGNITKDSEFNVINDPFALKIILGLNCKKILIPINVCRKVIFTKSDFDQIYNNKLKNAFKEISNMYIKYYTSDKKYGKFKGGVMYDLLTISYLIDPTLFSTKKSSVSVILTKKQFGKTELDKSSNPNCLLVTNVNTNKLKDTFYKVINGAYTNPGKKSFLI